MRAIFLADAHLQEPTDHNYKVMLQFLDGLIGSVDTIFILGDFFEFWIGYPGIPFQRYIPVVESLKRLTDSGVKLVYFEGNHDFHMGDYFRDVLDATIYKKGVALNIDGKVVDLSHGDQMSSDFGYKMLRLLLHSFVTKWLTYIVPPKTADRIAVWMGKKSKGRYVSQNLDDTYRTLALSYAKKAFAKGSDIVISGHMHVAMEESIGSDKVIILGDWISLFTYAEWIDGEVTLRRYGFDSGV